MPDRFSFFTLLHNAGMHIRHVAYETFWVGLDPASIQVKGNTLPVLKRGKVMACAGADRSPTGKPGSSILVSHSSPITHALVQGLTF